MNNALTGLGLALVLALVAALIGPWFVNWSAYRGELAAQASALIGSPVRISGAVDARLLPTPYLRFRNASAGEGAGRLSVEEVELEIAFAPLMRGEIRAERLRLVRPQLEIRIGEDGSIQTPLSSTGRTGAAPSSVSFDRAEIIDGSALIRSAAGERAVVDVNGVAEAGSLAGPFKFEGSGVESGWRYEARLSTGRSEPSGRARVKLALARQGAPWTLDVDGTLASGARPVFEGRAVAARPQRDAADASSWRVAARLSGTAGRLRADELDIAYGPDDRAVRLAGSGEARLGAAPGYDVALSARQVDLDRSLGDGRPTTPAGVVAAIMSRFPEAGAPGMPGKVALDLRSVIIARDVVRDLKAELRPEGDGWRIGAATASLPGDARVSLSGTVALRQGGPAFAGPVDFSAGDLPGFRGWLAGGEGGGGPVRRVAFKGALEATLGSVIIDEAEITAEGERSTGRLAWRSEASGERVELSLTSDRLDLDAFGTDRILRQAFASRSLDASIDLKAKSVTLAGVRMNDVVVDGRVGRDGVDLRRLRIGDAGGATLSGEGRVGADAGRPDSRLAFEVKAPRLAPLLALAAAAGASPDALDALEGRAGGLAPLALRIEAQNGGGGLEARIFGDAAGGRIEARYAAAELKPDADAEIDMKIVSTDGRRLAQLAGFVASPAAEAKGGEISLHLTGAPSRGLQGEGRFTALGLDLRGAGRATLFAPGGFSAEGEVTLEAADLSTPAAAAGLLTPGLGPALPAKLVAKAAFADGVIRLEQLHGSVAQRSVGGRLAIPLDPSKPIEGAIRVDELPLAAVAGLALPQGAASRAEPGRSLWPSAAFGPPLLQGVTARIEVAADKAPLVGSQVASDARFVLALRRHAVAIEKLDAALAGGRLTGSATIARSGDDATVALAIRVDGAKAERLLATPREASPLIGAVDLALDVQGGGRSLAGVVASSTGAGSVTLNEGALRRFDLGAIERLEPKVEAGLALDGTKVADALAADFDRANLRLPRAVAPFTVSGGVARSATLDVETPAARLGGAAALDLRRMTLDADLVVQGNARDAPQLGVSFEGPAGSPRRRFDATALTSWLSVRAVERETRRIEAMEADIQERARIARQRAEDERRRAEEEKRRQEEERRKADAEKARRDSEARALVDSLPRAPASVTPPPSIETPLRQRPPTEPPAAASPLDGIFGPTRQ